MVTEKHHGTSTVDNRRNSLPLQICPISRVYFQPFISGDRLLRRLARSAHNSQPLPRKLFADRRRV